MSRDIQRQILFRLLVSQVPRFEDFIDGYDKRPHGSLDFDELETPEQAFWRKMPVEAIFGIGNGLFGLLKI